MQRRVASAVGCVGAVGRIAVVGCIAAGRIAAAACRVAAAAASRVVCRARMVLVLHKTLALPRDIYWSVAKPEHARRSVSTSKSEPLCG